MPQWQEITVYVHGITPEEKVKDHTPTYTKLHNTVNNELKKLNKPPLGEPVMVEWGWEGSTGKDKDLAEAERKIAKATFKAYNKAFDFPLNLFPSRLIVKKTRPLFLYGIADMFYYVSEDGKKTIRKTVFDNILNVVAGLSQSEASEQSSVSLTCIGHSAGTVVLHDLLYNIFTRKYTLKSLPPAYNYVSVSLLSKVRELAENRRIRLRKFYTFGSPITPLTFRSNNLIDKVVEDPVKKEGFLELEDIGITDGKELTKPRWVNFWDPDDAISYPLEFLYDNSKGLLEDKCIDVSDRALAAHGKYWTNKKIARYIAETY